MNMLCLPDERGGPIMMFPRLTGYNWVLLCPISSTLPSISNMLKHVETDVRRAFCMVFDAFTTLRFGAFDGATWFFGSGCGCAGSAGSTGCAAGGGGVVGIAGCANHCRAMAAKFGSIATKHSRVPFIFFNFVCDRRTKNFKNKKPYNFKFWILCQP